MNIECPNCQTKFNLPDGVVGPDGVNLRCAVCRHVFHWPVPPDAVCGPAEPVAPSGESSAAPESVAPPEDGLAALLTQESHTEPGSPGSAALPAEPSAQDAQKASPASPAVEAAAASGGFASMDLSGTKPQSETQPQTGLSGAGWALVVLMSLVVLGGIFGAAAHLFKFWPFEEPARAPAPSTMQGAPIPPKKSQPQPALEYAAQLKVDHNFYWVENDRMGTPGKPARLLVIYGKVTNNSPATLGQITLEATVYDSKNTPIAAKSFLAGPRVITSELKTMSQEDLESRLRSSQEIMLANSHEKPGDSVPFTTYFANVPDVKTYSVKPAGYSVIPAGAPPQPQAKQPGPQPQQPGAQQQQPGAQAQQPHPQAQPPHPQAQSPQPGAQQPHPQQPQAQQPPQGQPPQQPQAQQPQTLLPQMPYGAQQPNPQQPQQPGAQPPSPQQQHPQPGAWVQQQQPQQPPQAPMKQ